MARCVLCSAAYTQSDDEAYLCDMCDWSLVGVCHACRMNLERPASIDLPAKERLAFWLRLDAQDSV